MNLHALKIFCDIVRLHSFSLAAEENGITQSAASQNPLQIERTLGTTLLDRKKRPFRLTEEGQAYYQGVKDLVSRYFAVEGEVRNLNGAVRGEVRVAAIYSVGLRELSGYVQQFSARHPGVSVKLAFLHPDRVYESIQNEEADIGLISYAARRKDIEALPWKEDALVVASAPGRLPQQDGKLRFKDLEGRKFVAFDQGLLIRKEIDRYLTRQGVQVDIAMSFDNVETIKRAVEIDSGVSILPESHVANETKLGTLEAFALPRPGLSRPIGIIVKKNRPLLRAASMFVDLLQEAAGVPRSRRAA